GQVVRGGHRGGRPAPVRGRSTLMLPGSIVGPKSQGGEVAEVLATVEEDREPAGVPARVVRIQVRSVDSLIAYSLIAAVGLWRAWAVVQWTFRQDDWVWATAAARTPFLRFVTTQINGHLLPGALSLLWAATRAAPLNFGAVEAPLLIISVIGGVLMWRLLGALFGERPANLIRLAVFLLRPLPVPPALLL